MSKTPLPLCIGDISAFARSLRHALNNRDTAPGHVEMLNLVCKAVGYRNFQHFKARTAPTATTAQIGASEASATHTPNTTSTPVTTKRMNRLARYFDEQARFIRWPGKFSQRMTCLWVMWSRVPARTTLTEKQLNDLLASAHLFGDHALLRRELVDRGMMDRTADGRQYRRREVRPPDEALALLQRLREKTAG